MASGATLDRFTAFNAILPTSNYPWLNFRNLHPVLQFDKATQWSCEFESILPRNYGGGGLTVTIYWMAPTLTTGDVNWNVAIERQTTDLDVDGFASPKGVISSAPATSGVLQSCSISFASGAEMDSLAAGEPYRIYLTRVAADGGDTLDEDAQFFKMEVKET